MKKFYSRTFHWFLMGVGLMVLFTTGCGGRDSNSAQPKQKKAPLVQLETVTTGRIQRAIALTCEVIPIESIQISSTVEGPIGYCPWREGDRVEAGQKLIEIDREMYRAEVKAAEAALAVAQAKLDDLNAGTRPEEIEKARQGVREAEQSNAYEQADFERIAKLVKIGALPGEGLDKAHVQRTAAEAKLAGARQELEMLEAGFTRTAIAVQQAVVQEAAAKLELARARLDECIMTAPFAGTITEMFVRQGDMAAMKVPLLRMVDMESLVVRCAVPEAQAGVVKPGMPGEVRLDALPGIRLQSEVVRVYPELDPRMRTRTIELVVKDDTALAPGMFGRVRLIVDSFSAAVTVPVQSVIVTPSGAQVAFVAAEGKAVQRKVQTDIEENGRIQVLTGLMPGEQVIVAGQEKLKDGGAIRLAGSSKHGQAANKPAVNGEGAQ